MNIVYYRRKSDGKITSSQDVTEKISVEELPDKLAEYNKNAVNTAELFVIEPNSFEEHLWNKANAAANLQKETIEDLESSLHASLGLVYDLMSQLKQGG